MYRRKPQGWLKYIDFVLLDVVSLVIACFLAALTRHGANITVAIDQYYFIFSIYLLMAVLFHIVNNTFANVMKRGYYEDFAHTLQHVIKIEFLIIFFLFSAKQGQYFSRIVIYLAGIYYCFLSYATRMIWKQTIRRSGTYGSPAALYIITTEDRAESTVNNLAASAKGEYQVQGLCILDQNCIGQTIAHVEVTAGADTLYDYLCDKWIDEVFISIPAGSPMPHDMVDKLTEMGIAVHVELEEAGSEAWQIRQVQQIGNRTVQTISITNISTRQALAKRLLDIAGGLAGCLITVLLTIIIGPIIYFHSPGPIFFAQTRVGKNGKLFKMYKFRSMYPDAEARKAELMKNNRVSDGMMFKLDFDPRIIGNKLLPDGTQKTGIGQFIRDYSLDEFPQFFNVLRGELSLCGTRPPTVDEWKKYNYHHRARLATKPGITGLWQVSGRSQITNFEEVVELDKKYIREWSLGLDFRILLKTVLVVLRKEGAM